MPSTLNKQLNLVCLAKSLTAEVDAAAPSVDKAPAAGSEADILSFVQRKANNDLLRLSVPFARSSLSASLATTLAGLHEQVSPGSITDAGRSHLSASENHFRGSSSVCGRGVEREF